MRVSTVGSFIYSQNSTGRERLWSLLAPRLILFISSSSPEASSPGCRRSAPHPAVTNGCEGGRSRRTRCADLDHVVASLLRFAPMLLSLAGSNATVVRETSNVLNPLILSFLYGRSRQGQALSTSPREEAYYSFSCRSRLGAEMAAAAGFGAREVASSSPRPRCLHALSLSRAQGRGRRGRPSAIVACLDQDHPRWQSLAKALGN
jgi:hypothetical protein